MKIGSLFSGYGGLDLGVKAVLDADVVWHCEWEAAPSAILERNFPGVPNYRDVSKVDWSAVEPVDILTGGFPCQDVSLAGRRKGMANGTRSGLWSEYAKAIDTLKPKMVIIENVRGLLSARADSGLGYDQQLLDYAGTRPILNAASAVLGDLADLGYDASWETVRASDAGAAHRRERVFIIAHPHSLGGGGWSDAPRRCKTGGAFPQARVADSSHRGAYPAEETNSDADSWRLESISELDGQQEERIESPFRPDTHGRIRASETITDTDDARREEPGSAKPIREKHSSPERASATTWGEYEQAIARWETLTGRAAPAPTTDGKLSPVFVEWLMGLEPGWVTDPSIGISRNDQLKALGNGVVPQQAELAIRRLI